MTDSITIPDSGAFQASKAWTPLRGKDCNAAGFGIATYRMLTRHDPADPWTAEDEDFDTHVFASILSVSATEEGQVADLAGLSQADLDVLLWCWFPHKASLADPWSPHGQEEDLDEIAMIRELLLASRSSEGEAGRLLAHMIARRCMEPSHLWEDLGLRDRQELKRLLTRHFAPLAEGNTQNMRWKRFFYRQLCEAEGFTLCSTPVCSDCDEFETCFGEETGESRLAVARRAADLGHKA